MPCLIDEMMIENGICDADRQGMLESDYRTRW